MDEIRALSATGMLGSGFLKSSFEEGLSKDPHFIGCDAGSTDPGPYYLGSGKFLFSEEAYERDLRLMLLGAMRNDIPMIVGSAGTGGANVHLGRTVRIVENIAKSEDLHFKMAVIHAEQSAEYLKKKLKQEKIQPLNPAPKLDEDVIENSERFVGMMGAEPIIEALKGNAQVIIAGRSSDTSIFAALPVMKGFDPGVVWHAAKVLECGTAAATYRPSPDSIMGFIRKDHFVIEPLDPNLRCTPQSVAAHNLYENPDPYHLYEPSGMLDTSNSTYEAVSDKSVKVSGSEFKPADVYQVKLEGAEKIGYQTIIIGGIRDPLIINQLDKWLNKLDSRVHKRVSDVLDDDFSEEDFDLNFRVYGRDGTMGDLEPVKEIRSHELGLIIEITADSQDRANLIAQSVSHLAVHNPIPEWSGLITSLAYPYAPSHIERGEVYRFCANHLVEPGDPYEMFQIEYVDL